MIVMEMGESVRDDEGSLSCRWVECACAMTELCSLEWSFFFGTS